MDNQRSQQHNVQSNSPRSLRDVLQALVGRRVFIKTVRSIEGTIGRLVEVGEDFIALHFDDMDRHFDDPEMCRSYYPLSHITSFGLIDEPARDAVAEK